MDGARLHPLDAEILDNHSLIYSSSFTETDRKPNALKRNSAQMWRTFRESFLRHGIITVSEEFNMTDIWNFHSNPISFGRMPETKSKVGLEWNQPCTQAVQSAAQSQAARTRNQSTQGSARGNVMP
jgi:hypothetical protein